MRTQSISIGHIPALLWGEATGQLILAIHGDMASKADPTIALLAKVATQKKYQVLSFDLPEHGDRKDEPELCKVQICVDELRMVLAYARSAASEISLFACSLGAYFSLMAYHDEIFRQAFFLSPVVDLQRLLQNMMASFGITEARLEDEREIPTPIGKTLYWDYYCYVKAHPVDVWNTRTSVLYGEKDDTSERDRVVGFCQRLGCGLTVMPGGGHWFHTDERLAFYKSWLEQRLTPSAGWDRFNDIG